MKLAEFCFVRPASSIWRLVDDEKVLLCPSDLCEFWVVPNWAKALWVELHSRPGKYRYRLEPIDSSTVGNPIIAIGDRYTRIPDKIYDLLKPFFCQYKKIYVEVWFGLKNYQLQEV